MKEIIMRNDVFIARVEDLLLGGDNILIAGEVSSGKTEVLTEVIKKINKRSGIRVNVFDRVHETDKLPEDFLEYNSEEIRSAVATIEASNEIEAIQNFAKELGKSIKYVMDKVRYIVLLDRAREPLLINMKNLKYEWVEESA